MMAFFKSMPIMSFLLLLTTSLCSGQVLSFDQINSSPSLIEVHLASGDRFGSAITTIGDLNGDGINDLAIGAFLDDAVWVLFMNEDGTVKTSHRIDKNQEWHEGRLNSGDRFGNSLTSIDFDGDLKDELIVGAPVDGEGAVWILSLNEKGEVAEYTKIDASSEELKEKLSSGDRFGYSLSPVGDLNGDSVPDLAVGAIWDSEGVSLGGATWILFMASGGDSIASVNKINSLDLEISAVDQFGSALTLLEDLDNDGIRELAVGANRSDLDNGNRDRGAVWILFLDQEGNVDEQKSKRIILEEGTRNGERAGRSLENLGFVAGSDSLYRLAVGAHLNNDGGDSRGAVYILTLDRNNNVQEVGKISDNNSSDYPIALQDNDFFGESLGTWIAMEDSQNKALVVGATADDDGGEDKGSVTLFFADEKGVYYSDQKISDTEGGFMENLNDRDFFGSSVAVTEDINENGFPELIVGTPGDDTGGPRRGAVRILYLNDEREVDDIFKISSLQLQTSENEPILGDLDLFGSSIANLGDLDGDNTFEFAVGAPGTMGDNIENVGAIWLLSVGDNTLADFRKVTWSELDVSNVKADLRLGTSLNSVDINGDGRNELIVGVPEEDSGEENSGAVKVVFLDDIHTIDEVVNISIQEEGVFDQPPVINNRFGVAVTGIDDLNEDGFNDLAVSASGEGGKGEVWILFMKADGTVQQPVKINEESPNFSSEVNDDTVIGYSLGTIEDMDRDNSNELVVGVQNGAGANSIRILFLDKEGAIKEGGSLLIDNQDLNGMVGSDHEFGVSVSSLGDNFEDLTLLSVGAPRSDDGGADRGTVWLLSLNTSPLIVTEKADKNPPIGSDFILETEIRDNNLASAGVHFRIGGGGVFFQSPPDSSRGSTFKFTVPAFAITDRGVEYFYSAVDSLGFSATSDTLSLNVALGVLRDSLSLPTIARSGSSTRAYRLISFPTQLNDSTTSTLLSELGIYDDTQWRFLQLDRERSTLNNPIYLDNPDLVSMGEAYWMLLKEGAFTLETTGGVSAPVNVPFEFPLKEGWNLVSSPFTFKIPVANVSVSSNPGIPIDLYTYEVDEASVVEQASMLWAKEEDGFEAFQGYAVYVTQDDMLLIDPDRSSIDEDTPADTSTVGKITITSTIKSIMNNVAQVAIISNAESEFDQNDKPQLPVIGEYVSVYFSRPEWSAPIKQFRTDARPPIDEIEVWEFSVASNLTGVIPLAFDGVSELPEYYEVLLVDEAARQTVNLRETSTYSIAGASTTAPRELKLVIRNLGEPLGASNIQNGDLPQTFELHQNFPNPFRSSTTIPYQLPRDESVTLEIFDLLGSRVTTLVSTSTKTTGHHLALWDGRNGAGERVASGVYFVRITTDSYTASRKMMLTK